MHVGWLWQLRGLDQRTAKGAVTINRRVYNRYVWVLPRGACCDTREVAMSSALAARTNDEWQQVQISGWLIRAVTNAAVVSQL